MNIASDRELLERALRDQLRDQAWLVLQGHGVLSLLALVVLLHDLPHQSLGAWIGAVLASVALRCHWLLRNAAAPSARSVFRREHVITTALLGASWGTGAGFLAAQVPSHSFAVIFAILCTITAGAIITLAADRSSFVAMLAAVSLPLTTGLLVTPADGGTLLIVLTAACFSMSFGLYQRTRGALLQHLRTVAELEENRAALALEQAQLAAILQSAPVGIAVVDNAKRVLAINNQLEQIFGWKAEELAGFNLSDLLVAPGDESHDAIMDRLANGEIVRAEVRRRHRYGTLLDVRLSAVALHGTMSDRFVLLYEDIGERKQAEQALIASEARLRRIIASNIVGIHLWRPDGTIMEANDELLRITGYAREDIASGAFDWRHVTPPEYHEQDGAMLRLVASGRPCPPWRKEIIRKDGTRVPILIAVACIDHPCTEGVAFVLDMTEARKAELALLEAKDQAERAARAQAAFLANMSHEIRTPMNAVLGMIQLVLATNLEADQRRSLSLARTAADSLLGVLNDILDYSRIEADHLPIESIPFDLAEVIDSTTSLFAIQAEQKKLPLTVRVAAGLPRTVRGDPTRLRQVLANLLGNAVKFTQTGGITVHVDAAGGMLRFAVRDTGIGIPQAALSRVFEQFQQADTSTSRRFGGTGLGLAIVQRLVRLMGGDITVTSTVGEGTEFVFRLPLAPAERAVPAAAQAALESAPPRLLRILLAEDVEVNQLVARTMLERRGHTVDVVVDGRQAVDAVKRADYDIVLMDIQMPELDGIEATAQIRALSVGRRVPIVALTAHSLPDERERCLSHGMNGFLAKPFTIEALCATVERLARPAEEPLAPQEIEATYPGIIAAYCTSVPPRVATLRSLLLDGAPRDIARAAHAVKSSAVTIGAQRFGELLERIELSGNAGGLEHRAELASQVEEASQRVLHALCDEPALVTA